jgi:hypothetical protein
MSFLDSEAIQSTEQAVRAGELRQEKDKRGRSMSPKKFFAIAIPVFAALVVFWVLLLTGVLDGIF